MPGSRPKNEVSKLRHTDTTDPVGEEEVNVNGQHVDGAIHVHFLFPNGVSRISVSQFIYSPSFRA